jgi:RNA polymerase sigma-70 factor (ECF subfamily)
MMRPPAVRPELAMAVPALGDAVRARRVHALVLAHYDFIWRVLRRLGVRSGDIDDATQQVFWVAARKIDDVASGRDARFLLAIALRVAADSRRTARRRREVSFDDEPAPEGVAPGVEERVSAGEQLRVAEQLLDALPEEQRIVFVLFELEEKSTDQIATLLQIPHGTVASRLRRARAAFSEAAARHRARIQRGEPR